LESDEDFTGDLLLIEAFRIEDHLMDMVTGDKKVRDAQGNMKAKRATDVGESHPESLG